MATINDVLESKGALLKGGTMVDATIIHASSSTKNREKKRDPDMHQTKKGNQWFFGMKVHVGADVNSGTLHTVSVTPANASDIAVAPSSARKAGVLWGVSLKVRPKKRLGGGQKARNRTMSSIRNRVEPVFRVMKRKFGYTKVRYRGLEKSAAQVFTLIGLTNLYMKRGHLMAT